MLTLEICKRLKEAGFRQDTKLIYWKGDDDKWHIDINNVPVSIWVACPTADEIWKELTAEQASKLIYRWFHEQEPSDSIETALAEYWLEVNG